MAKERLNASLTAEQARMIATLSARYRALKAFGLESEIDNLLDDISGIRHTSSTVNIAEDVDPDDIDDKIKALKRALPTVRKEKKEAQSRLGDELKDLSKQEKQQAILAEVKSAYEFNDEWVESAKNFYAIKDLLNTRERLTDKSFREAQKILSEAGKQRRTQGISIAKVKEAIAKAEELIDPERYRK